MTTTEAGLARLEASLGQLVASHSRRRGVQSFARYRDDPVGFLVDVLHADPWEAQRAIAGLVLTERNVVVRSCNGAGKDWLAARLSLWWVYARRGLVLCLGPTERQVKNVVMGEVARAFAAAKDLPGELYEMALRVDRGAAQGILAFTSSDASRLSGFHAPAVMVVITEAQGVAPYVWEGAFACTTGAESRILAVGNPLVPSGRFYEASRSPHWKAVRLNGLDHPNVVAGREVIPGAITREFADAIRREFGEDSGTYRSRVLGEFPDEATDTLIRRSWCEAAMERFRSGDLEGKSRGAEWIAALDPARMGPDQSVLALLQGSVVRCLVAWSRVDTMETTGRLLNALRERRLAVTPEEREGRVDGLLLRPEAVRIVVDEVGLGAGVLDRLTELRASVEGFNGGRKGASERFLNARAEAYWILRQRLEAGTLALPPDERLVDELAGIQWRPNSTGRIQLEAKEEMRERLGRSPDRADAVSMAVWAMNHGTRVPRLKPLHW